MKFTDSCNAEEFIARHRPFLGFLASFPGQRPALDWSEILQQAGGPARVALITVDVVKGFCTQGALASPFVKEIVGDVARIIGRAGELGIGNIIFTCDSHKPDSPEFGSFPPHCLAGSAEAELEDELLALPNRGDFTVINKPSVNSFLETDLAAHMRGLKDVNTAVVMGDVTDLCLYQLATNVKMFANARGKGWRVIVPMVAVETYETSVADAEKLGILPHDRELLNAVFCYHMQLNGIEVVKDIR